MACDGGQTTRFKQSVDCDTHVRAVCARQQRVCEEKRRPRIVHLCELACASAAKSGRSHTGQVILRYCAALLSNLHIVLGVVAQQSSHVVRAPVTLCRHSRTVTSRCRHACYTYYS